MLVAWCFLTGEYHSLLDVVEAVYWNVLLVKKVFLGLVFLFGLAVRKSPSRCRRQSSLLLGFPQNKLDVEFIRAELLGALSGQRTTSGLSFLYSMKRV